MEGQRSFNVSPNNARPATERSFGKSVVPTDQPAIRLLIP